MTEIDRVSSRGSITLDNQLEDAREAVIEYGPESIDVLLENVSEYVGSGVSTEKVIDLMETCKHARGFKQMRMIAEIFDEIDDPKFTLLTCQARIDLGDYDAAAIKLKRLLRRVELTDNRKLISETLGLLGRAQKQKFVELIDAGNRDLAEGALKQSCAYHREAYVLDQAWHGANLAALTWRAEREGIQLDISARAVGEKLLNDLGSIVNPDPWIVAALAQAYMAQLDWDSGHARYAEYFRRLRRIEGRSAAFSLLGDIRQLTEIWLADGGGVSETAEIVEMLREQMARTLLPGVGSQDMDRLVSALGSDSVDPEEELQAMVASGEIIPVEEMCRVIENRHSVARITDRDGSARGTGFLLDARPLGVSEAHAVLVTNNHVIATEPTCDSQILPTNALIEFHSWGNRPEKFSIKSVLKESPEDKHDIIVCILNGLPGSASFASVKSPEERFLPPRASAGSLGRIHPIGHPEGGPLSLSLAGNEVVDHDLFKGPRGVRRLHYKANTKRGSSGSPVFGKSGHVVAVHRAFTRKTIEDTPAGHGANYGANEGVGIGSIISWF